MTNSLIIAPTAPLPPISFTKEAEALKEQALEKGALIGKVTTPEQQRAAVAAQLAIAEVLKLAEHWRKAVKAPVLEYGRKIDTTAEDFVLEVKTEELRLALLVADFQALENAKVRAEEQRRLARERELQDQRRQEEQTELASHRAEIDRLGLEQARLNKISTEEQSDENRRQIELDRMELERQQQLAEAKSLENLDAINARHCEAVAALPVAAPVRVEGQRVEEAWEFEVTDIWALARAHPALVRIEPRNGEIKAALKSGAKIAGIRAWQQTKASVRTGKKERVIDV
jgi:hypothetical protein